jgi:4-amino-4-deoxy-L-arabinose transferase-like glycosyltransferase
MSPGRLCAFLPPVYPTILAGCILTGHFRIAVVVVSSLLAAGLVYLTWRIGDRLFGRRTGLLAAGMCAVYPYYIWHDTVVQENATLAFVVALALWCLIRSRVSSRWAVAAGVALGLCALTKTTLLLFAIAAPLWIAVDHGKLRFTVAAYLGLILTLIPWLVRTQLIVGAPILYSDTGRSLFVAHNPFVFDYFPEQSLDMVTRPAFESLTAEERLELARATEADPHGLARSDWLWRRGMAYIEQHRLLSVWEGFRKIGIGFSPLFSPRKSAVEQSLYFLSYFPLLVGSIAAAWRLRARWRELGFFYLLIVMFALGTAVFWAHTSHRMYLDPCLMILSASTLTNLRDVRSR